MGSAPACYRDWSWAAPRGNFGDRGLEAHDSERICQHRLKMSHVAEFGRSARRIRLRLAAKVKAKATLATAAAATAMVARWCRARVRLVPDSCPRLPTPGDIATMSTASGKHGCRSETRLRPGLGRAEVAPIRAGTYLAGPGAIISYLGGVVPAWNRGSGTQS
jgi:hypothetical protein